MDSGADAALRAVAGASVPWGDSSDGGDSESV